MPKINCRARDENIKPQRIAQAFKQGTTNCLFLPIINWCEDKANNSTTDGTRKKYISKLNVAKKLEEKYRETGVVKEELQSIADKLQINIIIKLPFDTEGDGSESSYYRSWQIVE